jgi:hypothetical protein
MRENEFFTGIDRKVMPFKMIAMKAVRRTKSVFNGLWGSVCFNL